MAAWEEVKRLAADFQKIQLSSTSQKLSERNCIEIITWLIDKKLIELIFTTDGKEYLTPSQLLSDIKAELYDNNGRISLVNLAKAINVDLGHINANLGDLLKNNKDIQLVLGQLIDNSYIAKLTGEINEKLSQNGTINVSDLTIQYDLPAEFLQQIIEKNLGKTIFGKQDEADHLSFFTESFIARSKSKIRGALNGVTRPIAITSILNQINLSEKIFFSLFDQCSLYGTITGRLSSARYVPNVYSRSQNEWVLNFFKQNGYVEYDALTRLGVNDHKNYLKKQFSDVHFLDSCMISQSIIDRMDADIDECISSQSHIDLTTILPSVFNEKDTEQILNLLQKQSQYIKINDYIISANFVDNLFKKLDGIIKTKAKDCVDSGRYQQYKVSMELPQKAMKSLDENEGERDSKREERRKKASAGGKSGGGTQGRESKTKSVKKHFRGKSSMDVEEDFVEKRTVLTVVTTDDVKEIIQPVLEEESLDQILDQLTSHLQPKANTTALEISFEYYKLTIADKTATRRQTHNELQNKINNILSDVRLYEKGIKQFINNDIQLQLIKYLLKTLCTDVTNEILNYLSVERNSSVVTDNFTNEQRLKFVNDFPNELKQPLTALIKSLQSNGVDDFMNCVEEALTCCSMIVKKIDKKKDRMVVLNHKHALLEQMNKSEDPAVVLHLAVLGMFTSATGCMLLASGRHVAGILAFLKQFLAEGDAAELVAFHDFVTLMLSGGSEAENAKEKLKEKLPVIKKIANEFKKPGTEKS